jgi:hypothetical protein
LALIFHENCKSISLLYHEINHSLPSDLDHLQRTDRQWSPRSKRCHHHSMSQVRFWSPSISPDSALMKWVEILVMARVVVLLALASTLELVHFVRMSSAWVRSHVRLRHDESDCRTCPTDRLRVGLGTCRSSVSVSW